MPTRTIAGTEVQINDEGFMIEPGEWNKDIALELAKEEGIETLNENHWKIIEFCRISAAESGRAPTLRQITTGTGISTKELFALYPKGPAKKVARISGLGRPEGCV
ncbi:MAG: TusE/DsrC/DsvC family sulfur relay protein [Anaerolineales bacterium]|nr:MAG: TusE/DsrC/DsvC family sulfur relay protein [Anaerolineales bacterium]